MSNEHAKMSRNLMCDGGNLSREFKKELMKNDVWCDGAMVRWYDNVIMRLKYSISMPSNKALNLLIPNSCRVALNQKTNDHVDVKKFKYAHSMWETVEWKGS